MTLERPEQDHRMAMVQDAVRAPGSPLTPAIRALMEARFGHNFGQVRLHTDELAAASARVLNAQAYTAGSHIVFAEGRCRPGTQEGLWLLAHELAHVIQQRGKCSTRPLGVAAATDPLEREANRVADVIAEDCRLPPDFSFSAAPAGVIQCHQGEGDATQPCGGYGIPVDPITERAARLLLEWTYQWRPEGNTNDIVVYASENYQLRGVSGGLHAYANELLTTIRGWRPEERPNIINFTRAVAYFFVRWYEVNASTAAIVNRFYQTDHRIASRHNQTGLETPRDSNGQIPGLFWYPDHRLEFIGDPIGRFVCTEHTDHRRSPRGVIRYDIRTPQRQRRRATDWELHDFDTAFSYLSRTLDAEVRNKIQDYDPENSNFVIIAPKDLYQQMHDEQHNIRQNRLVQKWMTVAPSYDFPGGQWIKDLKAVLRVYVALAGAVSAAVIIVGTIAIIVLVPPAGVAAGAAVTTGVAPGVTIPAATVPAMMPVSQIVVPAGMVAKFVASGAITGGAAAAVGTFEAAMAAMAMAPAAKYLAGSAGVLMVFFNSKSARAATGNSADARFSAIRAVAVADFQSIGGVQSASSFGPPMNFQSTETAKGKFGLHTQVLFDNIPHIIIGQYSAK